MSFLRQVRLTKNEAYINLFLQPERYAIAKLNTLPCTHRILAVV
jgi:hypothetical protein